MTCANQHCDFCKNIIDFCCLMVKLEQRIGVVCVMRLFMTEASSHYFKHNLRNWSAPQCNWYYRYFPGCTPHLSISSLLFLHPVPCNRHCWKTIQSQNSGKTLDKLINTHPSWILWSSSLPYFFEAIFWLEKSWELPIQSIDVAFLF